MTENNPLELWETYNKKYQDNTRMKTFVLKTLLVIYGSRKAHFRDNDNDIDPECFVFLKEISKEFPIKYYQSSKNRLLVYIESAQELVDLWKKSQDDDVLGKLLGFKCLFHDSKHTKYTTTIFVRYKKEFYYITTFICDNSDEKETIRECKKDYKKAIKLLGSKFELIVVVEKKIKKLTLFKNTYTSIGTSIKMKQIYKGYILDEEKDTLVKVDLGLLYFLSFF